VNAVEIEQAVSELFAEPFNAVEFSYTFLQAFGNKETTLKKLRTGDTNKSDVGGVLQRNNIHLAVAPLGHVSDTLTALRDSPATARHKVKFILATDGERVEAEELGGGTPLECAWSKFPDHFGFFLPLAGITTVREIRDNAFDIRATSKLNRLYVELLKENPEWGTGERRHDMNHFMARLIFSFFAEDTGIFADEGVFTRTVSRMSEKDSSNTHDVIGALFLAMNTKREARQEVGIPRWADLPYVNGGLFSGDLTVPRFTRTARSYLLQVGSLNWKQINPDIFGSMIQAVADEEERGALGMHYTSVPNILKVLNPLFLDDLRSKLEEAADNPRKLLNLRNRIKRIRVFDPACGSGNFLVIAYKELRVLEHEINRRRREVGRPSVIPLTNFRGIELRDFAAEIARLALIIAEFQCDVLYRGQQEALNDFLPLDAENWITWGNALQVDWLAICPPTGTSVKLVGDDLFSTPLDQSEIDFENVGGETYICGNPPYLGFTWQTPDQKSEVRAVLRGRTHASGFLDYVAGWFIKAADWLATSTSGAAAFVCTNSLCQGQSVSLLWPAILGTGCTISFAHCSFKWANLASHNAGVTVVIVGLRHGVTAQARLYEIERSGETNVRVGSSITPYLTLGASIWVTARRTPLSAIPPMEFGNKPSDGGNLLLNRSDLAGLDLSVSQQERMIRRVIGSKDFISGGGRWCLWIENENLPEALTSPTLRQRIEAVRRVRLESRDAGARALAARAHQFKLMRIGSHNAIVVPSVSSEARPYLPVGIVDKWTTLTNLAFALYDAPVWSVALIASRLHLVWVATVCGKLKTDFRYSNTLGWNTFPVPPLSEQNRADLTRCAEEILLAREAHYPATIADLYNAERMPAILREAHERNDETLERIYIGRRFRNDTERLEKLFDLYAKMTANEQRQAGGSRRGGNR
jgi:hypothetical protein